MSYLLDTNVLSELVRPKPNDTVLAWFADVPDESLYISVLTLGGNSGDTILNYLTADVFDCTLG